MPSKRTNDSVDRILQEQGRIQNAEGVRDSLNERQVDAILESVGIDIVGAGPISEQDLTTIELGAGSPVVDRFSTTVLDDLLGDLPSVKATKKTKNTPPPAPPHRAAPARRAPPVVAPAPAASAPRPAPAAPAKPIKTAEPAERVKTAESMEPVEPVKTVRPQPKPTVRQMPPPQPADTTHHSGRTDTTSTLIIKDFLSKMAPQGANANASALNKGKQQFKNFFGESVAVVPDEKGRLREPRAKKRGLFGLANAEDTGSFVPISVSIGSRRNEEDAPDEPAPTRDQTGRDQTMDLSMDGLGLTRPAATEDTYGFTAELADTVGEYFPDGPQAAPPADRAEEEPRPARRKRGLLASLFGGGSEPEEEELVIPEAREEPVVEDPALTRTGFVRNEPPAPPQAEDAGRTTYRSKYAAGQADAVARPPQDDELDSITLSGSTLALLRGAVRDGNASRAAELAANPAPRPSRSDTSTIYRKKRDTVEFTPGKKKNQKPETTQTFPAAPGARRDAEPVGEPVMTSSTQVASAPAQPTTGFTMQVDAVGDDVRRPEDTQDFLAAMSAASAIAGHTAPLPPRTAPQPTPAPPPRDEKQKDMAEITSTFDDLPVAEPVVKPDTAAFVQGIAASINADPAKGGVTGSVRIPLQSGADGAVPDDDGRYAAAAALLTGTGELEPPPGKDAKKTKRPGLLRLGGTPDDEQDNAGAEPFATAEHPARRDYETTTDAPAVRHDLDNRVLVLGVSAIVAGVLALVLLYLGVAATGNTLPMPAPLNPAAGKTPLLATMLVLLGVVCALGWRTLADGLRGLVTRPSPDSMPVLAALGAAAQLIAFLVKNEWYDAGRFCLLAGPAALLFSFNLVGKWLDARTVAANFQLVSAGVEHAVAYRLKDAGVLRAVTRGLGEPRPCVLVSRPTQLLKGFLAGSNTHRPSDKNQQQFTWILAVCGLVSFLFTLLYRKDSGMAFTALSATLCMGAPLAGTLLSAVPACRMQRSAAQVGAVIPGWKDIRQLGRINIIQVTARDLFPAGRVELRGINPVHKARIDLAITYAASILSTGSVTLRDVFMNMIGDNQKLLCKVDDQQTVFGKGYVGWIDGERVLVGNRALMQDYSIELPSLEYEQRHTVNQRRVIYLAVSGKLFSMFQVSYQRDDDTAAVLDSLRRAGMSLIVDCDDFNCDSALLETVYGLPAGTVKVLTGAEREAMNPAVAWLPESEGNMLHLGSFASFVGGLEAAAGAAEGEHKAAMVLSVSVLFGCVLAVIMSLAGGIVTLPLPALVLYQAAWAVLALVFPLLQRY